MFPDSDDQRQYPNPPTVAWISKVDGEYLPRIQQVGYTRNAPLKFRIGGGASLGIVGKVEPAEAKAKLWQVAGVPNKWNSLDLHRCLEAAGFQDTILQRASSRSPWLVLTKVKNEFQDSQVFGVENNGVCLSISKLPRRKKPVLNKKAIGAGSWSANRSTTTIGPTADVNLSGERETEAAPTVAPEHGAKRPKVDTERPYEIIDCGGQGNCGWNSISAAWALARQVPLEQAKAEVATATKTLRSDIYTYLLRHADDYRHLWAPNPDETPTTAGGPVPDSFESWCNSTLRDGQWLCGLTLDAISKRCGVKIVVVEEKDDGSAPLCRTFSIDHKASWLHFPTRLAKGHEHQ